VIRSVIGSGRPDVAVGLISPVIGPAGPVTETRKAAA
jgi:hypothetical protein